MRVCVRCVRSLTPYTAGFAAALEIPNATATKKLKARRRSSKKERTRVRSFLPREFQRPWKRPCDSSFYTVKGGGEIG